MNRTIPWAGLVLGLLLAAGGTRAEGTAADPAARYAAIYETITTADWLRDNSLPDEAAALYAECIGRLTRLAADQPAWQPAVIAYRLRYCQDSWNALRAQPAPEPHASNTAPVIAAPALPAAPAPPVDTPPVDAAPAGSSIPVVGSGMPLGPNLERAVEIEKTADLQGALFLYLTLLDYYPDERSSLKGALRCGLRLGLEENTRALARRVLAIRAPDADLRLLAGLVLCRDGQFAEALPLLREAVKEKPRSVPAHVALGAALAGTGQADAAREAFKRAVTLNPKHGDAYYNLARLSLNQTPPDLDTARVHYRNARRHGVPADPELDQLLAE